jgi:hypothetical protein
VKSNLSLTIFQVLFLLANVAYFVVLDKVRPDIHRVSPRSFITCQATVGLSNTVAMDFGRALLGPVGGTVFAFMVAFSCFGALNGQA